MQTKKLLIAIVLPILFISCNENEDNSNQMTGEPPLVKTITKTYFDGKGATKEANLGTVIYNDDNIPLRTEWSSGEVEEYNINNNMIEVNNWGGYSLTYSYYFDNNERLIKWAIREEDGGVDHYFSFDYYDDSVQVDDYYKNNSTGEYEFSRTAYKVNLVDGSLSEIIRKGINGGNDVYYYFQTTDIQEFRYFEQFMFYGADWPWGYFCKKTISSVTNTDGFNRTFDYETVNGYPYKISIYDDGILSSTYEYEFK